MTTPRQKRQYTKRQFVVMVKDRQTGSALIGTVRFRPNGKIHWVRPSIFMAVGVELDEGLADRLTARLLRLASLLSDRKRREMV